MLYTVRGLEDGAGGVNIRFRIILKEKQRLVKTKDSVEHTVIDTYVGDRTGTIGLSLWDRRSDEVQEGNIIDIKNGYINRFKGCLRLNIGIYGDVEKVEEPGFPTVEEINERSDQKRWKSRL